MKTKTLLAILSGGSVVYLSYYIVNYTNIKSYLSNIFNNNKKKLIKTKFNKIKQEIENILTNIKENELKAIKIESELGDTHCQLIFIYEKLANLYSNIYLLNIQLEELLLSKNISIKDIDIDLKNNNNNNNNNNNYLNQFKCLEYCFKASKVLKYNNGNTIELAELYKKISCIYEHMNQFEEYFIYSDVSITVYESLNYSVSNINNYISLLTNYINKAKEYCRIDKIIEYGCKLIKVIEKEAKEVFILNKALSQFIYILWEVELFNSYFKFDKNYFKDICSISKCFIKIINLYRNKSTSFKLLIDTKNTTREELLLLSISLKQNNEYQECIKLINNIINNYYFDVINNNIHTLNFKSNESIILYACIVNLAICYYYSEDYLKSIKYNDYIIKVNKLSKKNNNLILFKCLELNIFNCLALIEREYINNNFNNSYIQSITNIFVELNENNCDNNYFNMLESNIEDIDKIFFNNKLLEAYDNKFNKDTLNNTKQDKANIKYNNMNINNNNNSKSSCNNYIVKSNVFNKNYNYNMFINVYSYVALYYYLNKNKDDNKYIYYLQKAGNFKKSKITSIKDNFIITSSKQFNYNIISYYYINALIDYYNKNFKDSLVVFTYIIRLFKYIELSTKDKKEDTLLNNNNNSTFINFNDIDNILTKKLVEKSKAYIDMIKNYNKYLN